MAALPPATVTPVPPLRRLAAVVAASMVVATACSSSSGRELRPPTVTVTSRPVIAAAPAGGITFTSPALDPAGALPRRFANGATAAPPLSWSRPPEGATELVLAAEVLTADGAARGALRWLVLGVDPRSTGTVEGTTPIGGQVVLPWTGPPPGTDAAPVRIRFRLFVLNAPVNGVDLAAQDLLAKVDAVSVSRAEFSAPFAKAG